MRPSQLFLPFSELHGQVSPAAAARLGCIREYLRRRFPDFVLQQRACPSGSAQVTLYRVQDGTLYRLTVLGRFLEEEARPEDIERLLEAYGVCDKLPASVLTPIVLGPEGVHVPVMPLPPSEPPADTRTGLGWVMLGRLMQATGLSLPDRWVRGPT